MDIRVFFIAFAMLFGAVFSIATSSIGIECYNSDDTGTKQKDEKTGNFNFLVINLVSALMSLMSSFLGFYVAFAPM